MKSSRSIFDNDESSPVSTALTEDYDEKASDRPSKQTSVKRPRRRLDPVPSKDDDITNNTNPQGDEHKHFDKPASTMEMKESTLMPVLLPPLNDPLQPTSALEKGPGIEESPYQEPAAKDAPEQSTHRTSRFQAMFSEFPDSPIVDKPISPIPDSISPTTPGFVFPFRSESNGLSHMVEYEEDLPNWKPTFGMENPGGDYDDDLGHQQSWPLQLEDLIMPNPPFISEDRFVYPTPSESRLSTITEEGTIRESVATPQNILASEVSAKGTESTVTSTSNTTRIDSSLSDWFSPNGALANLERMMNQLAKTPSEEN